MSDPNLTLRRNIGFELDRQLYSNLPMNTQQELSELVIHIADSNWADEQEARDLHFCIAFQPNLPPTSRVRGQATKAKSRLGRGA